MKKLTAEQILSELDGVILAATKKGVSAERQRIEEIYLACRGMNTVALFGPLVAAGIPVAAANSRILNAIAARNEGNDICSRVSGPAAAAKTVANIDREAIFKRMAEQEKGGAK